MAPKGFATIASNDKVPTEQLGGAGADATKFLRGDQVWAVPSGGGDGGYSDYTELMQEISPGANGAWIPVDLSGYGIAAGNVVEVVIANTKVSAERNGGIRTKGSSLARYVQLQEAEAGGGDWVSMHAKAGAGGAIELYEEIDGDMTTYLIGYWH